MPTAIYYSYVGASIRAQSLRVVATWWHFLEHWCIQLIPSKRDTPLRGVLELNYFSRELREGCAVSARM